MGLSGGYSLSAGPARVHCGRGQPTGRYRDATAYGRRKHIQVALAGAGITDLARITSVDLLSVPQVANCEETSGGKEGHLA